MVQTAVVYAAVAAAAGFAAWRLFLRGWIKRRAAKAGGCGSDCGCGD